MDYNTLKIKIRGRVQGVYFRQSAANIANCYNLAGYAKNLPDGSVEIVVQGDEGSLSEFLKWCQRGSLLAKVEGMSFRWLDDHERLNSFKVETGGSFLKDQAKSFLNLGRKLKKDAVHLSASVDVPKHIVIIPDGNRRWAKENGVATHRVYKIVGENMDYLIDGAKDLNIDHLTLWGFSTENWKRSNQKEISQLMVLFGAMLDRFQDKFHSDKRRFRHLGRKDRLPSKLIKKFEQLEQETSQYDGKSVNVAIDYGGRDELIRAISNCIKAGHKKVDEATFSEFLDTRGIPDPDLIIRTSGEKRLSGLMPWQSVYSEFYFTDVYFPDFGVDNLKEAIVDYSFRKRNFGGDQKKKIIENKAPRSGLMLNAAVNI
jgi:undecaprenyl diphosphate synthase